MVIVISPTFGINLDRVSYWRKLPDGGIGVTFENEHDLFLDETSSRIFLAAIARRIDKESRTVHA